jgi:inosine-uridine nucleoside N-ribohydrolase
MIFLKKLLLFWVLFFCLFNFLTYAKQKIIIDSDFAMFSDDAYALAMLSGAGDVDILGVTVVPGNVWLEEGIAYALRFLEIIARSEIPVVPGAIEPLMGNMQAVLGPIEEIWGKSEYTGAYSRPQPTSYINLGTTSEQPYGGYAHTKPFNMGAVEFIASSVHKNPGEITLFALGPCTNIALFVKSYPDLVPLVKRIIYMGGAFDVPGNTTPAAEFNFWFDPEAAKICLRSPFKEQIIVPLDICEKVFYTKEQYDKITAGPDSPLVEMFKYYHGPLFEEDPDYKSFVWDSITAAIFLQPDIVKKMEERFVDVDTAFGPDYGRSLGYGNARGRNVEKSTGFPAGTQKAKIIFDIDRDKFWSLFISSMHK